MNKSFFITAGSLALLISASLFWAITQTTSKPQTKTEDTMKPSSVAELTAETAPLAVSKVHGILIIDFYAEWCGPCKTLKPVFEEVAEEFKDKYTFARVNVDHCGDFAKSLQITALPTIVILSNGNVIDRITGMVPKETLQEKIEQALNGPQDFSLLSQEKLNEKLIQAIQSSATIDGIKRIIEAGADVNYAPTTGMMPGVTPLLMAIIINGSRGMDATELIYLLITSGASTEFVDAQTGTKTQAVDFVQMMSNNCKKIAENYDKLALLFKEQQSKSKECTESSCSI
jgi:thioredoxin 1